MRVNDMRETISRVVEAGRWATRAALAAGVWGMVQASAFAQDAQRPMGRPDPNAYVGMQPAATDVARDVQNFHNILLIIITAITLFVMALLFWVMVRYNRKANPKPSTFTHNTFLEVAWTLIPVLVLVFIATYSFPLLYKLEKMPRVDESQVVDIKVYGRQWFWSYQYGEGDDMIEFDSNMVPDDQIKPGQTPQLSVDNPMVVPAGKYVRLSISASDVIHAFAMPAFAIKIDAVPGRLNQHWFKVDQPGVFYGQCSELCGRRHAYMPIEIRVLPQDQYDNWLRLLATSTSEARSYLDQVQPLASSQLASAQ
jgi:cytochrome c oxidase subunit II